MWVQNIYRFAPCQFELDFICKLKKNNYIVCFKYQSYIFTSNSESIFQTVNNFDWLQTFIIANSGWVIFLYLHHIINFLYHLVGGNNNYFFFPLNHTEGTNNNKNCVATGDGVVVVINYYNFVINKRNINLIQCIVVQVHHLSLSTRRLLLQLVVCMRDDDYQ